MLLLSQIASSSTKKKCKPLTNPLLFLIPAARKSALSCRTIDLEDVDLNLKLDQQDNWIYSYTWRSMEDFAAKTLEMLCLGERQLYANKYAVLAATQQAVLVGGTVALGNSQFAIIGGEAWHIYQCPRIKVQAIDAEECYDSLPVRLTPQDHNRLVEFEQLNSNIMLSSGNYISRRRNSLTLPQYSFS